MAYNRFGGSIMKPNGAGETNTSPAPDVLQYASSILQYQQQMLRLTSLAADTLRLMLRQTQRQIDYMHALSRCQDLALVRAVTTEFAQQVNQEVSGSGGSYHTWPSDGSTWRIRATAQWRTA